MTTNSKSVDNKLNGYSLFCKDNKELNVNNNINLKNNEINIINNDNNKILDKNKKIINNNNNIVGLNKSEKYSIININLNGDKISDDNNIKENNIKNNFKICP